MLGIHSIPDFISDHSLINEWTGIKTQKTISAERTDSWKCKKVKTKEPCIFK